MAANPAASDASVITSLPDVSELPLDLDQWRAWFIEAARSVIRWIPSSSVAIFYQSDIRKGGAWIDKSYLVMRAVEQEGAIVHWHKIACRRPPGTIALGRPSYSHMLCVTREQGRDAPRKPGPDVLPEAGFAPWSRGMGVIACRVACAFLRENTPTRTVVDPFCGRGTVLAVANAMGFDAIGVDLSAKRCRAARALVLGEHVDSGDGLAGAVDPDHATLFHRGARLFDACAFFEAHEVWENEWRAETDERTRRFLQGLIQVAAAFHKLFVMEAPEAALRLLTRALEKLDASPEEIKRLHLDRFKAQLHVRFDAMTRGDLVEVAAVPKILTG